MKPTIDFDISLVRELFDYADGLLIWRERPIDHFSSDRQSRSWNKQFSGKIAGAVTKKGYVLIGLTIDGVERKFKAHRVVWAWHKGQWPEGEIDHEDHRTWNNRIENLCDTSHRANGQNQPMKGSNSSGATGVTWHKKASRWMAQITVEGKNKYLGLFDSVEDASAAHQAAAAASGFHVNHGKRTGAYAAKDQAALQNRMAAA